VLGLDPGLWLSLIGVLLTGGVVLAILKGRRRELALAPESPLGRAQLLFLLVLWTPIVGALLQAIPRLPDRGVFFVHTSFWITGAICVLLLLGLRNDERQEPAAVRTAMDSRWSLGPRYWASLALIPLLVGLLAYLTIASHVDELPGSRLRFAQQAPSQG